MSKIKRASLPLDDRPRSLADSGTTRLRPLAWIGVGVILLVTGLAYYPAMHGGFLLDDDKLVVGSRLVHASDGLYQFWFTSNAADYWPLTNTSFWLEWRMWGLIPTGYHVTNFLLHVCAALLIWSILEKLGIPGAFLAALLFSVHPVNVESVAWISQRKNALAMVFFLLSILWYLKAAEEKRSRGEEESRGTAGFGRWYWLSLFAFLLAMLSKGSVAVLPVILLLIVWWQRRRIGVSDVVRTAPFFLVAIVLSGVNVWFQKHGLDVVVRDVNFAQRLAGAGAVVWFYLAKALAPIHLVFVYPQWQVVAEAVRWWLPLAAAVIVTAVLARQLRAPTRSSGRALLFAWLLFCVGLAPVLGFTDVGFMQYSLVADHYQHIAIIVVAALVAAAGAVWSKRMAEAGRWPATLAATGLVGVLTFLTFQQNRLYGNAIDLYQDTVNKNPDSWMARNNLGTSYLEIDRVPEAMPHIQRALKLKPDSAAVHYNFGYALDGAGQSPAAIEELELALRLKPDFPEAHNNLGTVLKKSQRIPEAIEQFKVALEQRPDYPQAHKNLGNTLLTLGRTEEAIEHIREAVRLAPGMPDVHNSLGVALSNSGQFPEAIEEFRQAAKLKPDDAAAYSNLGFALAAAGRVTEGIEQYQQALRLNPAMPEAYSNLGLALAKCGRFEEAIDQYQRALKLKADDAEVRSYLGDALFSAGRLPEAIAAAEKGLELARAQGQTGMVEQLEKQLKSYRAGQGKNESGAARAPGTAAAP